MNTMIQRLAGVAMAGLAIPAHAQMVVWANTGEDKVTRDELRASADPSSVKNSIWDGTPTGGIQLFGARNETVAFNLVIEAPTSPLSNVQVKFDTLTGPGGVKIQSVPVTGNGVFNWVNRPIELFYVRYLQIKGCSRLQYDRYDERHVPKRFQRPWEDDGYALPGTGWFDRPDHDKFYPDIGVPMEMHPAFAIASGENQSVWVDVWIPPASPAGIYTGTITISAVGQPNKLVPISLDVRPFTLPEEPSAKTMLVLGYEDVNRRYTGENYPQDPTKVALSRLVRDRHFQMARRHQIDCVHADYSDGLVDRPSTEWLARLDGSLYTPGSGYNGTGAGIGTRVYSVGLYGGWWWKNEGEPGMRTHCDAWVNWFQANAPLVDYHLYLTDEPDKGLFPQVEAWAQWINNNPGPGQAMKSFCTVSANDTTGFMPSLDVTAQGGYRATSDVIQTSVDAILADPTKNFYHYNGGRPYGGTLVTEDDGVALRVTAWTHFKKKIQRWFMWESTYYNNFQGGTGQTNVFQSAFTFGGSSGFDPELGQTGWNYSNGDGVLFYPGTDLVYPSESYGLDGPIASLRLKHWRRGLQDYEYLALASAIDPAAVNAIVRSMVPKALWEYGVTDPGDPTWVRTDISWSIDPDDWEAARSTLACIIQTGSGAACGVCAADCDASGDLDIDDFICFQTQFAVSDPAADCDVNGWLDIDDFICFQTLFALGC